MKIETHYDCVLPRFSPSIEAERARGFTSSASAFAAWFAEARTGADRDPLRMQSVVWIAAERALERGDGQFHLAMEDSDLHDAMERLALLMSESLRRVPRFAYSPSVRQIADEARSVAFVALHMLAHAAHGHRVYAPAQGLAERLNATKLRGLRGEDVRLPFSAIYVAIPKALRLPVPSSSGVPTPALGAYLVETTRSATLRTLEILLVGGSLNRPEDVLSFHISIPLLEGERLEDALAERHARTLVTHDAATARQWRETLSWLFNFIVYATWPDAEREEVWCDDAAKALFDRREKAPKGSEKRRKLSEQLRAANQRRATLLGKSVKVLRRGTGSVGERVRGSGSREATGIERWTLIQGFWRRHHVGKVAEGQTRKDTPTTSLWIQPHWRVTLDGAREGEALPQADLHRVI